VYALKAEIEDCPATLICPNALAYILTELPVPDGIRPAFEPSNIENCVLPDIDVNVDEVVVNVLNVRPFCIAAISVHLVPPIPSVSNAEFTGKIVLLSPFAYIFLTLNISIFCVV